MPIFRRIDCIITASGIVTLCTVQYSMSDESKLLCSLLSTGILYSRLQRVTIPDAVIIQSILLKMGMLMLETCREFFLFIYWACCITLGNNSRFVHIVGYLIYHLSLIHISAVYDSAPMYVLQSVIAVTVTRICPMYSLHRTDSSDSNWCDMSRIIM